MLWEQLMKPFFLSCQSDVRFACLVKKLSNDAVINVSVLKRSTVSKSPDIASNATSIHQQQEN